MRIFCRWRKQMPDRFFLMQIKMVFFMPFCKKSIPPNHNSQTASCRWQWLPHWRVMLLFCLSLLSFSCLLPTSAQAGLIGKQSSAQLEYRNIKWTASGYATDSDIAISFHPRVQEALLRGVTLYFILQSRIESPRWYWWNKVIEKRSIQYRLSYHSITRSYRLSIGNFHRSFDSLANAVAAMAHIRNWMVVDTGKLVSGKHYLAWLRFFHDSKKLPAPFQVTSLGHSEWDLDTGWQTLEFIAGSAPEQERPSAPDNAQHSQP